MCDTCGCGAVSKPGDHVHTDEGHHHGTGQARTLQIRHDVLATNDAFAMENRHRLDASGTVALNLISSPGAGKTTLLEKTIRQLGDTLPVAVIEGDLQTDRDAARIRGTGAPVYQINTGEGCHLDAHMVGHAMDHLTIPDKGVLFIENVGNLVCPASFELGEAFRVVVLSVAEGDDKVEKYPISFRRADLLLINKIDLLEHVDFSIEQCRESMKTLNPKATILEVSARTGTGIDDFCHWVRSKVP